MDDINKFREADAIEDSISETSDVVDQSGPEVVLPMALEPRIAFDAAAGAELVDHVADEVAVPNHQDDSGADSEPDLAAALAASYSNNNEIVFIDAGVGDPAALVAAVPDGAEVYFIDGSSDGITQIADVLSGRSDVTAIHILSHGEAGSLTLGSSVLNAESIGGSHADALAEIGASLTSDADILIYGCDFGGDTAALAALADATGADVAASDDTTGAMVYGGDWDLEVASGDIEAQALTADDWDGSLGQNNSGSWSLAGFTEVNNNNGPTVATNTTAGVTTTIEFAHGNGDASFSGFNGNAAFGNHPGIFENDADGDPSLSFVFYWGEEPLDTTGTGIVTIRFSQAQTNPIINIDRIGGAQTTSNTSLWTLNNTGATLTKVSGFDHFDVTDTTFQRTPDQVMLSSQSEAGSDASRATAAGSVQVNGTFTEISFTLSGAGGATLDAADGVEIGVTLDPAPNATNDAAVVIPGQPALLDVVGGDSGNGVDSDFNNDAFNLTSLEDPNNPGVELPFAANSTVTLTTGTTVTFGAAANDPLTIVKAPTAPDTEVFNYTITDANGGSDTAEVTIRSDHDGDGIANNDDVDDDNDGILDVDEGRISEASLYAPTSADANALNNSSGVFSRVLPLTIPGPNQLPNNGVTINLDETNQSKFQWSLFSPPNATADITIRGVDASLPTPYLDIVGDLDRTFNLDFGATANSLSNGSDEYVFIIGVAGLGNEQGGPARLTSSETLTVEAIDDVFNTNTYSYLDGQLAIKAENNEKI